MRLFSPLRIALVSAIVCVPSFASVITFTDRTAFDSAVGATTVETFGATYYLGLSGPISSTLSTSAILGGTLAAGTLQPGATYSTTSYSGGSWPFNIDDGGTFASTFLDSYTNGSDLRPLTVTFDTPVFAIGFDTTYLEMPNFDVTIYLEGGGSETVPGAVTDDNGVHFYGYQSTGAGITSVTISGSGSSTGFAVDNFTYGGTAPTPEPAACVLSGLGLLGLLCRRRA